MIRVHKVIRQLTYKQNCEVYSFFTLQYVLRTYSVFHLLHTPNMSNILLLLGISESFKKKFKSNSIILGALFCYPHFWYLKTYYLKPFQFLTWWPIFNKLKLCWLKIFPWSIYIYFWPLLIQHSRPSRDPQEAIFLSPLRDFWDYLIYPFLSTWISMWTLDKVMTLSYHFKWRHLAQKKNQITCKG